MKTRIFTLTLLLTSIIFNAKLNAATFTYNNATAWQNWSTPANWTIVGVDGDGLPDADDDVTIPTGFQVTANLTSSMNSLTINGDIRFRNPVTPTLTIATLNMNGGTLGHNSGNRVGVVNVTGDMKLLTGTCTIGEVSLNVAGTLRVYSTYNESSTQGTITFASVQMYFGSNWFYNNTETFNVTNNFTMKGATVDGSSTGRFIIGGNLIIDSLNNNWGRSRLTENGTLIINNGATLTITDLPGSKIINNLTVNSGGTWDDIIGESWNIAGNIVNNGTINMNAGTWTLSGTNKTISGSSTTSVFNTSVSGSYTNNGTYMAVNTLSGAGTFTQGTNASLSIDRTSTITSLNTSATGNTVFYSGNINQTVKNPADGSYYNLSITGSSGNKSLSAATVVINDLSISSGVSLDVTNANNYQLTVGGDWTNNGTFVERSGLVIFNGSAAQSIFASSTETFRDLQFNNSGTKTLATNIVIVDDIDILNPATLDVSASNYSITVGDDWTNTGVFIPHQGTVTLSNTSTGTINGAGSNDFYNLVSNSPSNTLNTSATLSGTLSIPSGNFTTTGQTFTLLSTATATGNIAAISAPRFTGNITMQRHIPGTTTGWGLLGSCITTTLASWTDDFPTSGFTGSTGYAGGFISIYSYNEAAPGVFDNPAAYVAATNASNAVTIGSGRWVYLGTGAVTTSDMTVDVTGAPKIGNHNFGVTFTSSGGASHDGWNLVANPYPSTIDWNAASGWTKSNVSGTIYIWNADFNQFATWNGTTGTNGGTRYIASSQGFYVQTTAAAPVLSCTESVKTSVNATMLREGQNNGNGNMIRFIVKGNGQYDETLFGYAENASNDFDINIDAIKMKSPVPAAPSLTQITKNNDLAMNFVANDNRNAKILLRFLTATNADYTLDVQGIELFPANECVTLKDLKTGLIQDLRANPKYNFYAYSNDIDARFEIIVSSPLDIIATDLSCGADQDGAIEIPQIMENWNYQISSNAGITIAEGAAQGQVVVGNLKAGNYLVRFNNGGLCNVLNQSVTLNAASPVIANAEIQDVNITNSKMLVRFTNQSLSGTSTWDFGDGTIITTRADEIQHEYKMIGTYQARLTVRSGVCEQIQNFLVKPTEQITIKNKYNDKISLFSNSDNFSLNFNFESKQTLNIVLFNSLGQILLNETVNVISETYFKGIENLAQGVYFISVYDNQHELFNSKIVK